FGPRHRTLPMRATAPCGSGSPYRSYRTAGGAAARAAEVWRREKRIADTNRREAMGRTPDVFPTNSVTAASPRVQRRRTGSTGAQPRTSGAVAERVERQKRPPSANPALAGFLTHGSGKPE